MDIELHWLDWVVIAAYFVMIVAVGLYVARKVKGTRTTFSATAVSACG